MYSWVKPKSIIPVHGEHRHMIEQAKFAKEMKVPHSLQIENGDIIKIYPGDAPKIIDKAPSGRMYLDGYISVRENSNSFKGLPVDDLDETFIFDMEDEIADICKTFSIQSKKQEYNLIDTLKQNCRRIVREKTGKKPHTRINLARI